MFTRLYIVEYKFNNMDILLVIGGWGRVGNFAGRIGSGKRKWTHGHLCYSYDIRCQNEAWIMTLIYVNSAAAAEHLRV